MTHAVSEENTTPGGEPGEPAAEPAAGQPDLTDEVALDELAAAGPAAELAERTADLQRLTAEYANYRRRVERDRTAAADKAKDAILADLLAVVDDLERARAHGDLETGPLKSLADKLGQILVKQGLVEFGAEGEPFNPDLHEAVQHEGSGHEPVIGSVLRKGYSVGDRVLRHALVAVTDGPAQSAPAGSAESV